jgi:hypothetical protein
MGPHLYVWISPSSACTRSAITRHGIPNAKANGQAESEAESEQCEVDFHLFLCRAASPKPGSTNNNRAFGEDREWPRGPEINVCRVAPFLFSEYPPACCGVCVTHAVGP